MTLGKFFTTVSDYIPAAFRANRTSKSAFKALVMVCAAYHKEHLSCADLKNREVNLSRGIV